MSVVIRLARRGTRNLPYYHVVVADKRRAVKKQFIEKIGTYNPLLPKDKGDRMFIDLDRAKYWLGVGAQMSTRVQIFLAKQGICDPVKITVKTKEKYQKNEPKVETPEVETEKVETPEVKTPVEEKIEEKVEEESKV
ncbi:MAG: 30S ribosomal protein S16 [Alphaproteobacteria bacterium]|nr:30S ribosomal protein S16 [Alphaproteobacteria bacterium]MBL0718063.1 30S ribosomal protein S16 [Alphaproteobacteria bacterium]